MVLHVQVLDCSQYRYDERGVTFCEATHEVVMHLLAFWVLAFWVLVRSVCQLWFIFQLLAICPGSVDRNVTTVLGFFLLESKGLWPMTIKVGGGLWTGWRCAGDNSPAP
jgi:hypothetical protein